MGFGHGAFSGYIAAALEELGQGHLTTVDLVSAREGQQPTIEDLLARTGLQQWVTVVREPTSYTWFLKRKIEEATSENHCRPIFDFCFLDGAKNGTIDGAAFFLADKLLKPCGWFLFDDLQWTYASKRSEGKQKSDGVVIDAMGADEIEQPHVELIFQYLVMPHPDYANFLIKDNGRAWAQKTPDGDKVPKVVMSRDYRHRPVEWEARTGRRHRPSFEPFFNQSPDP